MTRCKEHRRKEGKLGTKQKGRKGGNVEGVKKGKSKRKRGSVMEILSDSPDLKHKVSKSIRNISDVEF